MCVLYHVCALPGATVPHMQLRKHMRHDGACHKTLRMCHRMQLASCLSASCFKYPANPQLHQQTRPCRQHIPH